jgi:hypothetical protein
VSTLEVVDISTRLLNANLAEIAKPWHLEMELAHATSLNALKVKFAKMDNALHRIKL